MRIPAKRLAVGRYFRLAAKVAWALAHRDHPFLVQLTVTRRCNLACTYCSEYDAVSAPVPAEALKGRIDRLSSLGTAMITFTGGEPLLHPDLELLIAHARRRGMWVTMITNGYLLTKQRIENLNRARLDHLQISIDNVEPDEVSKKSLRLLDPKLRWLAKQARFSVSINSVLGGGILHPNDALVVTRRARELGLAHSVGIMHDSHGQLSPLSDTDMAIYDEIKSSAKRGIARLNGRFQDNLAHGLPNDWRCRAGSRFLYIDEYGLVHYCSQQRGTPAIPLESYGVRDLRREYGTKKACAPYCTLNCVQEVAFLDSWRSPQDQPTVRVKSRSAEA